MKKDITQRIENLGSFEETISRIDELNHEIVDSIEKLSNYSIDEKVFDAPQSNLIKDGIDVVYKDLIYLPILKKFCNDNNGYSISFLDDYKSFQNQVFERILIGKKVIEHKAPRGLKIYRKEREEEILEDVAAYGKTKGLDGEKIKESFLQIMKMNKDVQKACEPGYKIDEPLENVRSMTTQSKDVLYPKYPNGKKSFDPDVDQFTMSDLEHKAKLLSQEEIGLDKIKYKHYTQSKVTHDDEKGTLYTVNIVKETNPSKEN